MQIRKACNICGSGDFKTVFRLDGFDVVRCRCCNTYFRNIVLDKDESRDMYGKDYFCDQQKNYFFAGRALREKASGQKVTILNSLCPGRGRILDIGCGTGYFLKAAKDAGWQAEGIEISSFAADYVRTSLKIPVNTADFLDAELAPGSYDVITMWDMIDHSEYPGAIIKKAHGALKPGGLVAMDTFMIDGLLFQSAELLYRMTFGAVRYPLCKAYPVHHSHYFSTATFASLLERNDFDIVFRKGSQLEPEVVSLGFWGRRAVSAANWLTDYMGTKMEMILVGRKHGT